MSALTFSSRSLKRRMSAGARVQWKSGKRSGRELMRAAMHLAAARRTFQLMSSSSLYSSSLSGAGGRHTRAVSLSSGKETVEALPWASHSDDQYSASWECHHPSEHLWHAQDGAHGFDTQSLLWARTIHHLRDENWDQETRSGLILHFSHNLSSDPGLTTSRKKWAGLLTPACKSQCWRGEVGGQ